MAKLVMTKLVRRLLLVALVLSSVVVQAPRASAEPSPPGCDRGAFCAYDLGGLNGDLLLEVQGDWRGRVGEVGSVINNGVPLPGKDHVQLTYHFPGGAEETNCLHYNPGPGSYRRVFIPDDAVVTSVVWRGEC